MVTPEIRQTGQDPWPSLPAPPLGLRPLEKMGLALIGAQQSKTHAAALTFGDEIAGRALVTGASNRRVALLGDALCEALIAEVAKIIVARLDAGMELYLATGAGKEASSPIDDRRCPGVPTVAADRAVAERTTRGKRDAHRSSYAFRLVHGLVVSFLREE